MPAKLTLREGLKLHLPSPSLDLVLEWIGSRPIQMKITRGRTSKLGDYRPPQNGYGHRISVNGDLNPYEFLITLAHELAHLEVWEKYGRRVRPHGNAWKHHFAEKLSVLLDQHVFPEEMKPLILKQIQNPKATSKADSKLTRALDEHSGEKEGFFLEDLPAGAVFSLMDGRKFRKEEKLRKWYRCVSLDNRRMYRISPVARVKPL